ncbi:Protein NDUFAF4 [Blattella germanica]|nr:Protein NDUFAF4 [Blattella germanica]
MGKALSIIQRRVNRFNVENRAERIISKEKPTPAPKHQSTVQEIEAIKSEFPDALQEQLKKDSVLDDRLKKVFVQSHDPLVTEDPLIDPTRPLPQDRKQVQDFEFGFKEPSMIPQGRFTLKQAIKFIADHQTDPNTWTAAAIAKEYKINEEKLEQILKYFRTFRVHIPDKKTTGKMAAETAEKPQKLLESKETASHQERK